MYTKNKSGMGTEALSAARKQETNTEIRDADGCHLAKSQKETEASGAETCPVYRRDRILPAYVTFG